MTKIYKELPSLERLNSLFEVVPVTTFGVDSGLTWKVTRAGKARAGNVAGCFANYTSHQPDRKDWKVDIDSSTFAVSRVIYKMVNNVDPKEYEVDHIDRNPANNNPENLRLDTTKRVQNNNKKILKTNKTGAKGVSVTKNKKKPFLAHLSGVPDVPVHVGYFYCLIEAADIYNKKVLTHLPELYEFKRNDLSKLRCDCGNCAKILNRASVFEI